MATVTGVVRYHVAGLPAAALLSAVETTATVQHVAFGRIEGVVETDLGPAAETLRQWWSADLAEPSFASDFAVTLAEASVIKTGLFESDITLTRAAAFVAFARALAERARSVLPPLKGTIIVGELAADGTLSCSTSTDEIVRALKGIGAQCLIGPFSETDLALQGVSLQPAHTIQDLLRVALGDDPDGAMRLVLEWLVLFDPETKGAEAALWHEAERRAAESLSALVSWLNEVNQRSPRSRVIQTVQGALESLVKFQTGEDVAAPERTVAELENTGYRLTAVWLLTRWAFLLREQRQENEADQCLARALEMQKTLPLSTPVPVLLHQVGRWHYYRAHFPEALRFYWIGYSSLEKSVGRDELRADFYNSAGKCFNDTYQFAVALELFERARQIRATLRQDEKLARTWGAIGEIYWRVGDLDDAERCFRQDLHLSLQADQARHERRDEMRAKNYLANALFAKGAWAEADALYRETEAYYRARFDTGNTSEFGNLAYSVEGLARTAAVREEWDEVARREESLAELAQRLLKPDEPAILPVALLKYLHALKERREDRPVAALARLYEADNLLERLYPAERAMVEIEILIHEVARVPPEEPLTIQSSIRRLEVVSTLLWSILDAGEKPAVRAYFAPIRQEVEQGRGALGIKGQELLARDRQRRKELSQQLAIAHGQLATSDWSAATRSLRQIQESVVFFRDIIKQVAL